MATMSNESTLAVEGDRPIHEALKCLVDGSDIFTLFGVFFIVCASRPPPRLTGECL